MEPSPHFNFRDVLWTPAKALSAKQILSMSLFLLVALAIYDLCTYLAYTLDGESLGVAFRAYGLFPFINMSFDSAPATVMFATGVALALFALMLGFVAVGVINIEAARGNRFLSTRGAIKFAFVRVRQLFLSELAIVLFVAFIVLLFVVLGLVSRIPFIGEWLYTLVYVVPTFIISLFSVFIIFVFTLTFLLLPAVASAERRGETFNAILETFSTIIRQPLRWAGYTAYSIVAAKVCSFIYAYFCFRAVQFATWSSSLSGGVRLERLVKTGLGHLPVRSDIARETFNIFPGIDFGFDLSAAYLRGSQAAIGHVMAFMLFLIFISILGYALAIVASAQARGYVALRYIKDGYSIAEEDPLFFIDEHVNPPVEVESPGKTSDSTDE